MRCSHRFAAMPRFVLGVAIACGFLHGVPTQAQSPLLSLLQRQTNGEVRVRLSTAVGEKHRLEVADPELAWPWPWQSLFTLQSTGANTHLDTSAPFVNSRLYRSVRVAADAVTGDHVATTNGEVVIHPINHASVVLTWNDKTIYVDPVGASTLYTGLPRADLILVSHIHGDHFSTTTLDAVRGSNCVILAPSAVYNSLTIGLRPLAASMANGASTNLLGLTVDAIPAYNSNHPLGTGNGYVVDLGGKRFYFSGDTGDIPETRALQNIEVAFLCVNLPFTMSPTNAVSVLRAFHPRIAYPYHYRDQSGAITNAAFVKQQLGSASGIDVRLRNWY
jgi:L-ascorbate metabolism protein UlaG (beta-lactamase superfamily)